MANFYLGSIDLNKIKKENIQTKDKDGNAFKNGGKFLNISIWLNDEPDKFGNQISIKAGTKDDSYYIGNAKKWEKQEGGGNSVEDDDLPF